MFGNTGQYNQGPQSIRKTRKIMGYFMPPQLSRIITFIWQDAGTLVCRAPPCGRQDCSLYPSSYKGVRGMRSGSSVLPTLHKLDYLLKAEESKSYYSNKKKIKQRNNSFITPHPDFNLINRLVKRQQRYICQTFRHKEKMENKNPTFL